MQGIICCWYLVAVRVVAANFDGSVTRLVVASELLRRGGEQTNGQGVQGVQVDVVASSECGGQAVEQLYIMTLGVALVMRAPSYQPVEL